MMGGIGLGGLGDLGGLGGLGRLEEGSRQVLVGRSRKARGRLEEATRRRWSDARLSRRRSSVSQEKKLSVHTCVTTLLNTSATTVLHTRLLELDCVAYETVAAQKS